MDEVDERVRRDIEVHGWHVALFPEEGDAPSWGLTIGLHQRFSHPEVAVFGLPVPTGHALLNAIGLQVKQGLRFAPEQRATGILEGRACAFQRIHERWFPVFLGNGSWFYQREVFPALQCFWPDAAGRFPWDPGYESELEPLQPRLFEADPDRALSPALARALRDEGALA